MNLAYLPFVDGLRAVAIIAVVAYHAFPNALPGGFVGVDVFFVISGFLITRFIAAEMADGSFSLTRFFIRRARRLLPAAVVCFSIVSLLAALVLLPDSYVQYGRSLMAAGLMYANIFFDQTGGYFSAPALEKPLLHTWSLAVEDQFYLTWPLILMLVLPLVSRRGLMMIGAGITVLSLGYAEWMIRSDPEFAFFMLPTRAWELMCGAMLALAGNGQVNQRSTATALEIAGAALILASVAFLSGDAHFPGLGALPACVGTMALIAAGQSQATVLSRFLSLRPVVFIGLISYSLYLWHWPLIALQSYRLERQLLPGEAMIVILISLICAVLSWRFVERPFRSRHGSSARPRDASGNPWAIPENRRFAIGATLAALAVVAQAVIIKSQRGLPGRFDGKSQALLEQMVASNPRRSDCDNYDKIFGTDSQCNFGRRKSSGESYEVIVLGDSMADHWVSVVERYATDNNMAGRQVTNGGCILLLGTVIPARPEAKARECAAYQREAEKFLDANPSIKVALISAYWEKWIDAVEASLRVQPNVTAAPVAGQAAHVKTFHDALDETVGLLTRRGIHVILIGQIPVYESVPTRCIIASIESGGDASSCGKVAEAGRNEVRRSDELLRSYAQSHANVSSFLPSEVLCSGTHCAVLLDGEMVYRNGSHLNRYGALALGRRARLPRMASRLGKLNQSFLRI